MIVLVHDGPRNEETELQALIEEAKPVARPKRLRDGVWILNSSNVSQMVLRDARAIVREGRIYWSTVEEGALRSWPHG